MAKERIRICTECGNAYPLTREFFAKEHNKFRNVCRNCVNEHNKFMYNIRYDTLEGVMYLRCKKARERAHSKHMKFDLTPEFLIELWNLQGGKCFYSGLTMSYDRNDLYTVSVDRVDSNKGYTQDNVVLCCWSVNSMKNSYTVEEFLFLCESVVKNQVVDFVDSVK